MNLNIILLSIDVIGCCNLIQESYVILLRIFSFSFNDEVGIQHLFNILPLPKLWARAGSDWAFFGLERKFGLGRTRPIL